MKIRNAWMVIGQLGRFQGQTKVPNGAILVISLYPRMGLLFIELYRSWRNCKIAYVNDTGATHAFYMKLPNKIQRCSQNFRRPVLNSTIYYVHLVVSAGDRHFLLNSLPPCIFIIFRIERNSPSTFCSHFSSISYLKSSEKTSLIPDHTSQSSGSYPVQHTFKWKEFHTITSYSISRKELFHYIILQQLSKVRIRKILPLVCLALS